jgi:hypothetical protein
MRKLGLGNSGNRHVESMRALTVWPEWVWAIKHLGKDVENRVYPPPMSVRGKRIALHAGMHVGGNYKPKSKNAVFYFDLVRQKASDAGIESEYIKDEQGRMGIRWTLPSGESKILILEELTLGAVVATSVIRPTWSFCRKDGHECSPWAALTQNQWHLDDVKVLSVPISCSGHQGVWYIPSRMETEIIRRTER